MAGTKKKSVRKKAAPKKAAPLIKTHPEMVTDPQMMGTNSEKVLTARHSEAEFPVELRCRKTRKAHIAVTLFGRTWEVFAGKDLPFPAQKFGGMGYVHYELVHKKNWGGDEVWVYRKYETNRRYIESRGYAIPGMDSI